MKELVCARFFFHWPVMQVMFFGACMHIFHRFSCYMNFFCCKGFTEKFFLQSYTSPVKGHIIHPKVLSVWLPALPFNFAVPCRVAMADPGGLCPHPFWIFFKYKNEVYEQKNVLNVLNEICLKMLEMAIIETQIFKNIWGSISPDLPRKLAPSAFVVTPSLLKVVDPPLCRLF